MPRTRHIGTGSTSHGSPAVRPPARRSFTDACRHVIQQAFDTGAEVNVYLCSVWDTHFMGQVLEVGKDHFELFHSGQHLGMRWTLPFADVSACALVTHLAADGADGFVSPEQHEPPSQALS